MQPRATPPPGLPHVRREGLFTISNVRMLGHMPPNLPDPPAVWADIANALPPDPPRTALGPSDVGALTDPWACLRQLSYRAHGTPPSDPEPVHLVRAAVLGSALHRLVADGRRWGPYWDTVESEVHLRGLRRPVRPDAYSLIGQHVDDLKSVSDKVFRRIIEAGIARQKDRDQADVYGLAHHEAGFAVARCSVTYLNRETGESWADLWTWDKERAERLRDQLVELDWTVQASEPHNFGRPVASPSVRPCSECVFRSECWGTDVRPGGPAFATGLATPQIEQAANRSLRLAELRREVRELEQAAERDRDLLLAADGRRFVDETGQTRRVRVTPGKPPGEGGALDQRRARERLEYWGEEPPTLGTAPRVSFPVLTDDQLEGL